jgi:hypothetical protein
MERGRAARVIVGGLSMIALAACSSGHPGSSAPMPSGADPGARSAPELTYDSDRGLVLMINGEAGTDSADAASAVLWSFDGTQWSKITEDGPPGRSLGGVAYDSVRHRLVVAGGLVGDTAVSDTWEWDGQRWTRLDSVGPSPRAAARMAYDRALGTMILFGGANGVSRYLSDTWAWDGTSWRQLASTGPSPRGYHGMAYDEARSTLVLYGGYDGTDLGDTWEWSDGAWTEAE